MGVAENSKRKTTSSKIGKGSPAARDKALSPNGHTARFLYLMLKQVDIKRMNWEKVAEGTGIDKGSSARTRFARFKKQIESQILGDAIEIKREQEQDARSALSRALGDDLQTSTSKSSRAEGAEADHDGAGEKRVKLEHESTINAVCGRNSSIILSDEDPGDSGTDTPSFVKSEPETHERSSFPRVKREPENDDLTCMWRRPSLTSAAGATDEENTLGTPANPNSQDTRITSLQRSQVYRNPWAAFTPSGTGANLGDLTHFNHHSGPRPYKTRKQGNQEQILIDE